MKDPISKLRQRAVGERGRKAALRKRKVPFKDSVSLSVIYYLLLLVLVVVALGLTRCGALASGLWQERWLGNTLVATFSIIGMRVLLNLLEPEVVRRNSRTCLLVIISAVSVLITAGISFFIGHGGYLGESFMYLEPFAYPYLFAPMLATLLLGTRVGLATGIGTSMLMAQFSEHDQGLLTLTLGLLASIVVPHLVSWRVRKRMQLLRVALVTSIILTVGVFLYGLIANVHVETGVDFYAKLKPVLLQVLVCLLSGVGSTVAVLLLRPVVEHVFAVTSNITLQNFSDLGHPLIERLCQEAPGTYSHVITVATLSSVAADRIGANGLLARVASYYHDIGKLSTPGLFIENTTPERNPHHTLKPGTSASWLKSHVKDGVVLADRYRLPPPVKEVLWEHHGTTLIASFLHKAREQAREEEERSGDGRKVFVEESQYRYPGPRPSTRESGIIMLADSVEAAARSINKPTPHAIEGMVTDITEAKLKDGQLDDCPLTLRELAEVKKSFVASLSTILHARIAYPDQDTKNDLDNVANKNRKSEETPKTEQKTLS